MKFRTKFMLLTAVIVLVSVLVVSVFSAYFSTKDTKAGAERQLRETSKNLGVKIGTWLEEKSLILTSVNNVLTDSKFAMKNNITVEQLEQFINDDYITSIYMVFDDGFVVSSDGWVPDPGDNVLDRDYYKGAMAANGEIFYSDVYLDATEKVFVITIGKTLLDANGNTIGAVCEDVKLSAIKEYMAGESNMSEDTDAYLLDANNAYIYHKNEDNLSKNISEVPEASDLLANIGKVEQFDSKGDLNILYKIENLNWTLGVSTHYSTIFAGIKTLLITQIVITVIVTIISIFFAIMFGDKIIVKPIISVSERLARFSAYDFSKDERNTLVASKDEIGDTIRATETLQTNLTELFSKIRLATNALDDIGDTIKANIGIVSSGSDDISTAVEELAQAATRQAQDTEKGANDMIEFNKVLEISKSSNEQVEVLSEEVGNNVKEGVDALGSLLAATDAIKEAFSQVSSLVQKADESSERISAATEIIASIAGQTNLLALNAAIEAARAGEQGRGFAVVADEIKKLAENSSESAEEIKDIVRELLVNSSSLVETMATNMKAVENQERNVESIREKYAQIEGATNRTNDAVEISTKAIHEMDIKRKDIIVVLESLSAIAQQNAAGSEEASAATFSQHQQIEGVHEAVTEMLDLTEKLKEEVNKFKC